MKAIIAAMMVLISCPADAWVTCSGKVTYYEVTNDGFLKADWGYGPRMLCSLGSNAASPVTVISKEVCQAWYSNILTSFTTGRPIISGHPNSTTGAAAMGTNTYSWPAEPPYSFIVTNTGAFY